MTRNLLLVAFGMLIMFVLLKILAKNSGTESKTTYNFGRLAKTQQASNLVKTNEFRELVKTEEFKTLVKGLAAEEISYVASTLTNATKIV
jgi:hypothetical protein